MKIAVFSGALIDYSLHEALRMVGRLGADDGWVTLECFAPYPAYDRFEHDLREVRGWLDTVSAEKKG